MPRPQINPGGIYVKLSPVDPAFNRENMVCLNCKNLRENKVILTSLLTGCRRKIKIVRDFGGKFCGKKTLIVRGIVRDCVIL